MTELQSILIGVLANVIGDQVLVMMMSGALHLCGRAFAAKLREDGSHAAPDAVMPLPADEALAPPTQLEGPSAGGAKRPIETW